MDKGRDRPTASQEAGSVPVSERTLDATPRHTADLPDTPTRDRRIPASAWIEAPDPLHTLGDDIGTGQANFLRRIHGWLLWRTGPPSKGDARYIAIAQDDVGRQFVFRLFADGSGDGVGPSGATHQRFRSWKEDLRDAAVT